MGQRKKKIVLLGHSFVRSLDDHYRHMFKGPMHLLETWIAEDLKVSGNIAQIYLHGQGGATVGNFEIPKVFLRNVKADLIILDMGTNDLASDQTVMDVCQGIERLAKCLLQYSPAVSILSIVPRGTGLAATVTEDVFRGRMRNANAILKRLGLGHQNLLFSKQKGFYEVEIGGGKYARPVTDWSYDGIHPNNPDGRKLYKNSIRTAICDFLKK